MGWASAADASSSLGGRLCPFVLLHLKDVGICSRARSTPCHASPPSTQPIRHQLFVEMVRAESAQRQQAADKAAGQQAQEGPPLRPVTRPADLPIYGQEFLSRA